MLQLTFSKDAEPTHPRNLRNKLLMSSGFRHRNFKVTIMAANLKEGLLCHCQPNFYAHFYLIQKGVNLVDKSQNIKPKDFHPKELC